MGRCSPARWSIVYEGDRLYTHYYTSSCYMIPMTSALKMTMTEKVPTGGLDLVRELVVREGFYIRRKLHRSWCLKNERKRIFQAKGGGVEMGVNTLHLEGARAIPGTSVVHQR